MPNTKPWLQELFINEAKPALKRHAGGSGGEITGVPVSVTSAEQMESILAAATEADYGEIYHYLGPSTDKYEQGEYYILSEE